MTTDRFALSALHAWVLQQTSTRERAARQSLGIDASELYPRLYNAAESTALLLCALLPPFDHTYRLDETLRDVCRNLQVVLANAPHAGTTVIISQFSTPITMSAALGTPLTDALLLMALSALAAQPAFLRVSLTQPTFTTLLLEVESDVIVDDVLGTCYSLWIEELADQLQAELTVACEPLRWQLRCRSAVPLPHVPVFRERPYVQPSA